MGRGINSEPRQLLYGPRRSGPGPNSSLGTGLDLLGWSKFCSTICDILAEQGLALPGEKLPFANQNDDVKRDMIVIDWGDSHLRLTPYFDNQVRGVGIYHYSEPYEISTEAHLLPAGSKKLESQEEAEELLIPALRQRSLETVELMLDGQELLARLNAGEELDVIANGWAETTDEDSRLDACLEIIQTAREGKFINGEETSVVRKLIFECEDGDYFKQLYNHPFGAVAIGSQAEVAVRRSI